ncbi:SPASM domain-containing protein [Actinoplanes sp. NPDC049316]|uniref:SPASM domain-containing protein n=1 Tax=Actinoplanes sp. NPDC049316 TaxID=3154727 RepID=UPI00341CE6B4
MFTAAGKAAADRGLRLRLPATSTPAGSGRGCSWPWEAAYITSAGVVQPCCMVMGDDRVSLGVVGERTFAQIWHDEPYRDFRRRLAGDGPPEVCRGCSLYHRTF